GSPSSRLRAETAATPTAATSTAVTTETTTRVRRRLARRAAARLGTPVGTDTTVVASHPRGRAWRTGHVRQARRVDERHVPGGGRADLHRRERHGDRGPPADRGA